MDERFLFPEAHLLRQLTKRLRYEFPFTEEEALKGIFDSLDDLLLIVDKQTVIHYANPAVIRRFEAIHPQLIGKTLFEIMPYPQVKNRWDSILKSLDHHRVFSIIDSGHGSYTLSHILPFKDKKHSNDYYIILTVENNHSTQQPNRHRFSESSPYEETLKAILETPADYKADPSLEHQINISLALANAATGASLAEDLETALNILCTQACLALKAPAAVIRLYNSQRNTLEIAGSYGLSTEHIEKHFAIPYEPLAYLASEVAPRVVVADLDQSPPTPADQLPYRPQLNASVIGNIVRQNRFLGVLVILIPKLRPPLTKEDLIFIQAIAEQASIAIDRFRLMEIQEQRTKELEKLVHLAIELREAPTKRDVLVTILNALARNLNLRVGAAYLLEGDRFVLVTSYGENGNFPDWLIVPQHWRWNTEKLITFRNLTQSSNLLLEASRESSISEKIQGFILPLNISSATAGILLIEFPQAFRLSSEQQHEIHLLQEIGDAALHRADSLEHLEQVVLERTRELSILYEITSKLNAHTDLRQSIDQVLENVLSMTNADLTFVHLHDPKKNVLSLYLQKKGINSNENKLFNLMEEKSPWSAVYEQNSNLLLEGLYPPDSQGDNSPVGKITYFGLPIRSHGEIFGVLSLASREKPAFTLNDQVILTAIADQLGLAIERARLTEKGEEIAKLEERQRLARDLHDALTQSLYSMTLLASGYKRSLHHATMEEIHQWIDELNEIAQNALVELRLLLYELRPTALEQDGLHGALKRRLEAVEKRAGIQTVFKVHGGFRLPAEDEEHFYRIAQEALNNALQHAHHQSILVEIESHPDRFQLSIFDDGVGFDFDHIIQYNQHSGLSNMFARARQIGAQLSIDTKPGKGTKLLIQKEYNHV
ncbi:MAG: hypothetical protein Kow0088_24130 [Anaerolineales bacterium]